MIIYVKIFINGIGDYNGIALYLTLQKGVPGVSDT